MTRSGRSLKVVYFNYLYDLYEGSLGSTLKAQTLMAGLRERGHHVEEYWLNAKDYSSSGGEAASQPHSVGLKKRLSRYFHEASQIFKNFAYMGQEKAILKKSQPDLVIARHGGYILSTAILTKRFRIPFILEIDSPEAYENRVFYSDRYLQVPGLVELIERLNFRFSGKGFVQSRVLFDHAIRKGSFSARDLRIIPNAADEFNFEEAQRRGRELREKLGLERSIVIGFVGSFHYWHGVENLRQIIDVALQRKRDSQIHFLLVGAGGAKENELKEFVQSKGFDDRVTFTGFVNPGKVKNYLQAMDVVLAPYPNLDFFYYSPVKLFDYMAHGGAIVASRIAQIAEILVDRKTGLLCNPENPREFVEAIEELASDLQLRKRLGENARHEYLNKHKWIHRARELEEFCLETVEDYRG